MEALVKAFYDRYYTSSGEITTDSIANSLGIFPPIYEKQLRKAENRIMLAMVPYLKLFKAGGKKRGEIIIPNILTPGVSQTTFSGSVMPDPEEHWPFCT